MYWFKDQLWHHNSLQFWLSLCKSIHLFFWWITRILHYWNLTFDFKMLEKDGFAYEITCIFYKYLFKNVKIGNYISFLNCFYSHQYTLLPTYDSNNKLQYSKFTFLFSLETSFSGFGWKFFRSGNCGINILF